MQELTTSPANSTATSWNDRDQHLHQTDPDTWTTLTSDLVSPLHAPDIVA